MACTPLDTIMAILASFIGAQVHSGAATAYRLYRQDSCRAAQPRGDAAAGRLERGAVLP